MEIEDKITIIEGPPPTFEASNDGWVLGLHESPKLSELVMTRLRTFNGRALVERCHRAWRHNQNIYLEYRSEDGLEQMAPIVAARQVESESGDILLLWLHLDSDEVELELTYESPDPAGDLDDEDLDDISLEDLLDEADLDDEDQDDDDEDDEDDSRRFGDLLN